MVSGRLPLLPGPLLLLLSLPLALSLSACWVLSRQRRGSVCVAPLCSQTAGLPLMALWGWILLLGLSSDLVKL